MSECHLCENEAIPGELLCPACRLRVAEAVRRDGDE